MTPGGGAKVSKCDEKQLKDYRIEIVSDLFLTHMGKISRAGKITYPEPMAIDVTNDKDGQVIKGIYKLEGDRLTLCTVTRGNRPIDFSSGAGSANQVRIYKRAEAKP